MTGGKIGDVDSFLLLEIIEGLKLELEKREAVLH
jgi:hypothetical protein|tara:strand:- start:771 stop:872 length:102 start_codon:yes stop_codon:yes gene_type:complete